VSFKQGDEGEYNYPPRRSRDEGEEPSGSHTLAMKCGAYENRYPNGGVLSAILNLN